MNLTPEQMKQAEDAVWSVDPTCEVPVSVIDALAPVLFAAWQEQTAAQAGEGNPWRDSFPPGRLDAAIAERAWDNGRAAENARIVAALRAKGTHAADVLADQIEMEAP